MTPLIQVILVVLLAKATRADARLYGVLTLNVVLQRPLVSLASSTPTLVQIVNLLSLVYKVARMSSSLTMM